jgi:hypothetical protein
MFILGISTIFSLKFLQKIDKNRYIQYDQNRDTVYKGLMLGFVPEETHGQIDPGSTKYQSCKKETTFRDPPASPFGLIFIPPHNGKTINIYKDNVSPYEPDIFHICSLPCSVKNHL